MNLDSGKYMGIREIPPMKGKKTPTYDIYELAGGTPLGRIAWYGAWRSFCFYPAYQTVFDAGCTQRIVDWLEEINIHYKEQKKAADGR
jgi:hypothetical protein